MTDKWLMDKLEAALRPLRADIRVTDRSPDVLLSREDDVPTELMDGICERAAGRVWLSVRQPDLLLSCADTVPQAEDLLLLAEALVASLAAERRDSDSVYDVYRRILRGDLRGAELEALQHEYRISPDMRRCVLLFHFIRTDGEKAFDLLRDLTPMERNDVLVDLDRHTAAMIMDTTGDDDPEELVQFAQALQETLLDETARQMTVGIGTSKDSLEELRDSYEEARRAIEVGRVFQPERTIHQFHRLILERFLLELPQDISAYYHNLLFNRSTAKLFNEEMLYTIEMFFKKDLNLSDTARQLYIHRNTLVYRLDKIQRQTGLDLRSFDDAVTFKILMELKKRAGDKSYRP